MPWCDSCSRYIEPAAEGATFCAACGRSVESPVVEPRAPGHFKLLVAATVAYLGLRAFQGMAWLVARL